nr:hypothetical protein [Tanacetum cinerariifolium]
KVVESEVPKKRKLQEHIDAQVAKEMEEEFARENQRLNEQFARDSEIARLHAKEELKMMIEGLDRSNETKHFRGMTLEEIKEKFIPVWKQLEDLVPMSSKEESKIVERQGSSKRMKTSKSASEGVSKEELKEIMQQTQMAAKIKAQDFEISDLKARVKFLEDNGKGSAETSQGDAPIKGGSMEMEEEVRVERSTKLGSNDTKEMVNVLSSMEVSNILTSGVAAVSVSPATTVGVPTVSGLFPTASAIFTTASVVTPYSRRPRGIYAKDKGKEKVVESEVPKKRKLQEHIDAQVAKEMEEEFARENQRLNEQFARDSEIARLHAKEELKMMIEGLDRSNEVIAKHL